MSWSVRGDWGTTRLRLYRIVDGAVVDRADGPGIGALANSPAATLTQALANWSDHGSPLRITLVGMAGARSGLLETPYVACPANAADWIAAACLSEIAGIPVCVAAGVRQEAQDVMRGEEAQIFGAMAIEPSLGRGRQQFVLPGTHSKWATVEDGMIQSFRTYPTGELFALLRAHSTLLNIGPATEATEERRGWDDGLALAQRDADLLGNLFRTRAAQLLEGRTAAWAEGFLSGLLIGSEIAQARDTVSDAGQPIVIAEPALAARYCAALQSFGIAPRSLSGDNCVLGGLALLDSAGR